MDRVAQLAADSFDAALTSPLMRACDALCRLKGEDPMAWDPEIIAPRWARYVPEARAVLGAVADPSRRMVRAVSKAIGVDDDEAGLAIGEAMRAAARDLPESYEGLRPIR